MPKPQTMQQGHSNDFQTPPEAILPLLPYLKPKSTIWECAAGEGSLVDAFAARRFKVVGSDIRDGLDFLTWAPPGRTYDYIVTNPPYSLKQQFLTRCYGLGKPFALLLPLTTFETAKRQALFRRHGVQVIFFDKRINFKTPSGVGSGSWFATAWFTHGLNLPKDLTFVQWEG